MNVLKVETVTEAGMIETRIIDGEAGIVYENWRGYTVRIDGLDVQELADLAEALLFIVEHAAVFDTTDAQAECAATEVTSC